MLGFAQGGLGFLVPGLLGGQVALKLYAFAPAVLVGVAGHEALGGERLEVLFALAGDGQRGFELGDHGAHGGRFGLAALVFGRQPGQTGGDVAPLGGQLGLGVGLVGGGPVGGDVIFKGFFGVQRLMDVR